MKIFLHKPYDIDKISSWLLDDVIGKWVRHCDIYIPRLSVSRLHLTAILTMYSLIISTVQTKCEHYLTLRTLFPWWLTDCTSSYFSGGVIPLPVRFYLHTSAIVNSSGQITNPPKINSGTRKGPAFNRSDQGLYSRICTDALSGWLLHMIGQVPFLIQTASHYWHVPIGLGFIPWL